jgi:hypothetical protein
VRSGNARGSLLAGRRKAHRFYTIGHSTRSLDEFGPLVRGYTVVHIIGPRSLRRHALDLLGARDGTAQLSFSPR